MGQVSLEPKNSRGSHVRGRVMLEDCGGICALHMSSMRREEDLVPIMGCPSWAAIRYSWRFYFSFRRADRYLFFWGFLDKTFICKSSNTCLGKNTLFFCFTLLQGWGLFITFLWSARMLYSMLICCLFSNILQYLHFNFGASFNLLLLVCLGLFMLW